MTRFLVTSCGAPNGEAIFGDVRRCVPVGEYGSEDVVLVGVDCDDWAAGRYFCDEFQVVHPYGGSVGDVGLYIDEVEDLEPDWVLPLSGAESVVLKEGLSRPCRVLGCAPGVARLVMDKHTLYDLVGVEHVVCRGGELFRHVDDFVGGVVVKPRVGRGSRGVFLVGRGVDDWGLRLSEKPGFLDVSGGLLLSMLRGVAGMGDSGGDFVVMPRYSGREVFVNALCRRGEVLWAQCAEVLRKINNVASLVRVVEDEEVLGESLAVCQEIGADFWVNLQFVGGCLVEVNPRISSFVPAPGYSVPWLAVVVARGDDVSEYPLVEEGAVMQRYMATRTVY